MGKQKILKRETNTKHFFFNFKREINLISIGKYLTLTGQERSFPRQPSLGVGGGGMHCMVHTGIHSEEGFLEFNKY